MMKFLLSVLLILPSFAFNPFAPKKVDYTKFTEEKYGSVITEWIEWDKAGKKGSKPTDSNECFSLALDSPSRQRSCGRKKDPFACLGISNNRYYKCEWGDIDTVASYIDCKTNDYKRTNENCRCDKSTEKNDCKWNKYCYEDNTCNDKPKPAPSSGCHSHKVGTEGPYTPCHFPFTFAGSTYSKCVLGSGSDTNYYCGTDANSDTGLGVCSDSCEKYAGKCKGAEEALSECFGYLSPETCPEPKCKWEASAEGEVGIFKFLPDMNNHNRAVAFFLIACFGIAYYAGSRRGKYVNEQYDLLEGIEMQ